MQLSRFRRFVLGRSRRAERGQSVAEFALVIPLIVMFVFFVVQFSVVFTMIHQASFASFAAAKHHRVARDNAHDEQAVVDAVLRGNFWTQIGPQWVHSSLGGGGDDGGAVTVSFGALNTHMPYWPIGQLSCKKANVDPLQFSVECIQEGRWELPTHLGENVYEEALRRNDLGGPMRGWYESGIQKKVLTDNNIDDD